MAVEKRKTYKSSVKEKTRFEKEKILELLTRVMCADDQNRQQGEALKIICNTNDNLFITGNAGTGKSTFLRDLKKSLKNSVIVAPTGIAALNSKGMTIHSFFRFNLVPFIPVFDENGFDDTGVFYPLSMERREVIMEMDTLIIDEISMVRPDLLDRVAQLLRCVRDNGEPFGGVRIIMFGDLAQLPPIVDQGFPILDYYDTKYFFSSKALMATGFKVVNFKKIYRQKEIDFIDMLNDVRKGNVSKSSHNLLHERIIKGQAPNDAIYICATNKESKAINDLNLNKIKGQSYSFEAIKKGEYPKDAQCEEILTVKVGARVILTRNNGSAYVNGSMGEVVGIVKKDVDANGIPIKETEAYKKFVEEHPNDNKAIENFLKKNTEGEEDFISVLIDGRNKPVLVGRIAFENVIFVRKGNQLEAEVIGSITQFPIKIGYSISCHKSQGMTIESAVIKMDNAFAPGQVYTAISRIRTLDGLHLTNDINPRRVMIDSDVEEFNELCEENGGCFAPVKFKDMKRGRVQDVIDFSAFGL